MHLKAKINPRDPSGSTAGEQLASPNNNHVNNQSASCLVCLTSAPESLAHFPLSRRLRFSSEPLEPSTGTRSTGVDPLQASTEGRRLVSLMTIPKVFF
ncbi:BQ5605_C036g11472 [Microbotryum silenes-dioicae]|uniref:BQ5605_C036g11472 protein n=1 Tax=Microbotryum silenes-dioicae TaxID=796604 RepID=A0A2X0MJD5_9BASI|nr:BQ5605_C036g11472 [Microbotryum silenes-dioicae]